jgi:hypothetical protein
VRDAARCQGGSGTQLLLLLLLLFLTSPENKNIGAIAQAE